MLLSWLDTGDLVKQLVRTSFSFFAEGLTDSVPVVVSSNLPNANY